LNPGRCGLRAARDNAGAIIVLDATPNRQQEWSARAKCRCRNFVRLTSILRRWCRGTELNRRRQPFQGCALPPELPRHTGSWVSLESSDAFEMLSNGLQTVLRNILKGIWLSVKNLGLIGRREAVTSIAAPTGFSFRIPGWTLAIPMALRYCHPGERSTRYGPGATVIFVKDN
jgi:hypothetical protein